MTDEEARPDPREKFTEALKQMLEDFEYEGFLSDWVVITTQSHVHEDGSTGSSYSLFMNEHQAIHSTAGLLKYATLKNEEHILCPHHHEE